MLDLSTPPPQDLTHGKDSLRQPSESTGKPRIVASARSCAPILTRFFKSPGWAGWGFPAFPSLLPVLRFCRTPSCKAGRSAAGKFATLSALIAISGLVFGVAEPAFAALKVCHNVSSRFSESIFVAVGYKNKWTERRIRKSRSVIFGPLGLKKSYYIDHFQWVSKGWTEIPPNKCKNVLNKDLSEDYADNYYILAIGPDGSTVKVENGSYSFCINPNPLEKFQIVYNIIDGSGISEEKKYCTSKGSNYKFISGFTIFTPPKHLDTVDFLFP